MEALTEQFNQQGADEHGWSIIPEFVKEVHAVTTEQAAHGTLNFVTDMALAAALLMAEENTPAEENLFRDFTIEMAQLAEELAPSNELLNAKREIARADSISDWAAVT